MTYMVKKRKWDKILVICAVMVGFSVILMKLTGYRPCDIIHLITGSYIC
jgi:hypothetical protein